MLANYAFAMSLTAMLSPPGGSSSTSSPLCSLSRTLLAQGYTYLGTMLTMDRSGYSSSSLPGCMNLCVRFLKDFSHSHSNSKTSKV